MEQNPLYCGNPGYWKETQESSLRYSSKLSQLPNSNVECLSAYCWLYTNFKRVWTSLFCWRSLTSPKRWRSSAAGHLTCLYLVLLEFLSHHFFNWEFSKWYNLWFHVCTQNLKSLKLARYIPLHILNDCFLYHSKLCTVNVVSLLCEAPPNFMHYGSCPEVAFTAESTGTY
jgi:hypothetical protein